MHLHAPQGGGDGASSAGLRLGMDDAAVEAHVRVCKSGVARMTLRIGNLNQVRSITQSRSVLSIIFCFFFSFVFVCFFVCKSGVSRMTLRIGNLNQVSSIGSINHVRCGQSYLHLLRYHTLKPSLLFSFVFFSS
jgi:hypothetical protein